jgi:hypothetical protein
MNDLLNYMGVIFAAGAIGGTVNAILSDNKSLLPRTETADTSSQSGIILPGLIANMMVSGVAAVLSWGLYGPMASSYLAGGSNEQNLSGGGVTMAAFAGAILVGIAGARWLTNEVDKKLLRATATLSAAAKADQAASGLIGTLPPIEALKLSVRMSKL